MIFPDGNDYYSLDVSEILSRDGTPLYQRSERNKPYVYILLEKEED